MSISLQGSNALTATLTSCGLAIGSTTSQFSTANTTTYVIRGRLYSKAADATEPLTIEPGTGIVPTAPNTLQTLAAGQSCAFAVLLDTAGAFTVMQGDIVPAGASTPVPSPVAGKAIIGAIKVSNVTNPFIPGTTAFTATGVTTTYINLSQHPGAAV